MGIKKLIKVTETQNRYALCNFNPSINAGFDTDPIENIGMSGFIKEYVIGFKVGCVVRCNEVEEKYLIENAKKRIIREIYRDLYSPIEEAIASIYAGDKDAALVALFELKNIISDEELINEN